ncbi:DUF461 domain-containing protein [Streptomyces sp. 8N706]|uniref:DUF461 domain-containing protein n=1 Tax=Streptomyces sp. 8N706 TaxID=3457416 RepID=UPI003FD55147
MSLPQPSAGGAPSLRRGVLAVTAIALSVTSLTACGAGTTASTLQVKPDNAATAVGTLKIQNAVVITQPDGAEGPVAVSARIFNNGGKEETLEAVTVEGAPAPAKVSPAKGSGPVTIPAGGSILLGGKGNPTAVLARSGESLRDGDAQRVVFAFDETGEVPLTAFVVPAQDYFKDYGPTALPTPSTSPKPTGSPTRGASPTGSPTGSPAGEEAENGDEAAAGDDANGDASASRPGEGHDAGH